MDHRGGHFLIEDLPWGDYTLTETQAPAGYYPVQEPIEFTISGEGDGLLSVQLDPVVNIEIDGPDLPLTGGLGRDAFFMAGLSILGLGLIAAAVRQVRRSRRPLA